MPYKRIPTEKQTRSIKNKYYSAQCVIW